MNAKSLDEKAIFKVACSMESAEARDEYLNQVCGDDQVLFERVATLLRMHEEEPDFLESPPAAPAPTLDQPITEKPGTVIGRYKLLEQIGEGGMGLVFMARQQEPVKRNVALKLIKPGMDSRQVIARFEAERQALALMDHPNIAKVLDAGTTGESGKGVRTHLCEAPSGPSGQMSPDPFSASAGRPYFVMDLVKGIPITEYCDQQRLSTRRRLELFTPICQAVQHAHQKGIIHRDIKPTNVLVTLHDGTPVPKVIDFGVAKATNRELTQESLITGFSQVIGTPLYMSPEQAELSGLDIDTRTDVYSLGVLLYELLTGTTPFEQERFSEASYDEMRRIIREEEPPKPSTRISTLGDSLKTIAEKRHTDSRTLSHQVRGELDWIVMKALEKDRTRRYDSANDFARDVQRYLNNEAVEACPASALYRFRKFARRNKTAVLSTAAVATALVVGASVATWQAIVATRAKTFANQQQALAQENFNLAFAALDEIYLKEAEKRLPFETEPQQVDRELLQKGLAFYEQFAQVNESAPSARLETAKAYRRAGKLRWWLGDHEDAKRAHRRAITILEILAAERPKVFDIYEELSLARKELGRCLDDTGQPQEAEQIYRDVLKTQEQKADDFGDLPEYRLITSTLCNVLAFLLKDKRQFSEAEQSYRQAVAIEEKLVRDFPQVPQYKRELGWTLNNLASLLYEDAGNPEEAEKSYRRALSLFESVAAEPFKDIHWDPTAIILGNLGNALRVLGRSEEAEQSYRQAVSLWEKQISDYPNVPDFRKCQARTLHNLALLLKNTGQADEAEELYRRALAMKEKLATDFPQVPDYRRDLASTRNNLGLLLTNKGQAEEGETFYRQALTTYEKLVTDFPGVPDYRANFANTSHNLAGLLKDAGRPEKAEQAYCDAVADYQKLADGFPGEPTYQEKLVRVCKDRGRFYVRRGRWEEARADFAKVVKLDPEYHWHWYQVGALYLLLDDLEGYHRHCHGMLERFGQTDDAKIARRTARVCALAPDVVEAPEALVRLGELTMERAADYRWSPTVCGQVYYRAGQLERAVECLRQAADVKPAEEYHTVATQLLLAMARQRLGQSDQARESLSRARQIMEAQFPKADSGDIGRHWHKWLFCQVLRREAEELIGNEERSTAVTGQTPPNPDP